MHKSSNFIGTVQVLKKHDYLEFDDRDLIKLVGLVNLIMGNLVLVLMIVGRSDTLVCLSVSVPPPPRLLYMSIYL